jgi:cytoskeletal protein CcmA (bactofilin family)
MWKKDESQQQPQSSRPPGAVARAEAPVRPPVGGGERATIGRSITIRGDVSGDEDLVIQGTVEGTVDLKQHTLTIGPEGKVKAEVTGRKVMVEGEIHGNLRALEHVVLRGTARVQGDLAAPRVVIEDGAVFRGNIDMGEQREKAGRSGPVVGVAQAAPGASRPQAPAPPDSGKENAKT